MLLFFFRQFRYTGPLVIVNSFIFPLEFTIMRSNCVCVYIYNVEEVLYNIVSNVTAVHLQQPPLVPIIPGPGTSSMSTQLQSSVSLTNPQSQVIFFVLAILFYQGV